MVLRRVYKFVLLVIAALVALTIEYSLIPIFGWRLIPSILFIIMIGLYGEHYVSSQGYYHYTTRPENGHFAGKVPLWIPFLWLCAVHGSLLIVMLLGFTGFLCCFIAGALAATGDLVVIEPLLSRELDFWRWTPISDGYFNFVPSAMNRFTAPFGNYLVWFGFVGIANYILFVLIALFP